MKKSLIFIGILLCFIGLISYLNTHSTSTEPLISIDGKTMGTTYHIKICPEQDTKVDKTVMQQLINTRLTEIDQRMSTYKSNSELSLFNRYPNNQWAPISPELLQVLKMGLQLSEFTNGSFDMTVGKLVNLWGFGPTINTSLIPEPEAISQLKQAIGYQKLQLQQQPPALLKQSEEIYIDLSGIAKGYAVDAVAKVLTEHNINNFLVEIGGEIITQGQKENNKPWVVGIEAPVANKRSVGKKLYLHGAAMATSGDYRNYFDYEGQRYSHTIDPRTGYPITHKLASVTVVSNSCMQADGLATAFMVMGPEKGLTFAQENNIAIFMLIKHGNEFIAKQSKAFMPYLQQ